MTGTKRCSTCHLEKPLVAFCRNSARKDGLHNECRECASVRARTAYRRDPTPIRARNKAYRNANPDKDRAHNLAWRKRNPLLVVLQTIRKRAKVRGLPFDLTLETLPPIPPRCPALDIPLESATGNGGPTPNSPSLDRLVPEKGYVVGNVAWISMKANLIKQNATPEEIERVARWTREQLHPSHPMS